MIKKQDKVGLAGVQVSACDSGTVVIRIDEAQRCIASWLNENFGGHIECMPPMTNCDADRYARAILDRLVPVGGQAIASERQ